ncbi:MAG: DsrH/TusB family sulfur metabolism protein [Nitrospirota bacterium]
MKTLHIIRKVDDKLAQEVINHDSAKGDVSVLLIQDGVLSNMHGVYEMYASVNDVEARGLNTSYKLVDYASICQLIIDHDKVIIW